MAERALQWWDGARDGAGVGNCQQRVRGPLPLLQPRGAELVAAAATQIPTKQRQGIQLQQRQLRGNQAREGEEQVQKWIEREQAQQQQEERK